MELFLLVFIFSYYLHGLGVTIGYHRLVTHRAFRCYKFVEYFWVLAGYLALEGSPIWWAAIHRAHHRSSDTTGDPHSPKDGYRHAYIGWMFEPWQDENYPELKSHCRDLMKDPVYNFLEKGGDGLLLAVNIGFRVLLLLCFGWKIALANLLAGICVLQVPLLLNLLCHIPPLGYRNYNTADDSINVWWMVLLWGGEGWHNNHHAFPSSAKSGIKWFELDISWLIINLLHKIGLVQSVNLPRNPLVVKAETEKEPLEERQKVPA